MQLLPQLDMKISMLMIKTENLYQLLILQMFYITQRAILEFQHFCDIGHTHAVHHAFSFHSYWEI